MSHLTQLNVLKGSLLDQNYTVEQVNHIVEMCYTRALVIEHYKVIPEYRKDFLSKLNKQLDMWNEIAPFNIGNIIDNYNKLINFIESETSKGGYFVTNEFSYDYKDEDKTFLGIQHPEFLDLLTVLIQEFGEGRV